MYTAEVASRTLRSVRAGAPPEIRRALTRLQRHWDQLWKASVAGYQVLPKPPRAFCDALRDTTSAITDDLEQASNAVEPELLRFYFDALKFSRLLESFGDHSLFDIQLGEAGVTGRAGKSTVCVRNVVPAPFLKSRFAAARCTVLFSATLAPWHYHVDLLGLPQDFVWLDVPAPFTADQLSVRDVSTRYRHRGSSLAPIARLIARQFHEAPGNYIAFFSSFDYMEQAMTELIARSADIPVWSQGRRATDRERTDFVDRFVEGGRGVAFAVLGGVFAEGVDLPGTRLIGAFVATLGLPQFNTVNEAVRERLDTVFGTGHDFTYLYPGIRKVVQAAGRVIRSTTDRGTVHLIDDRFSRPDVARLLPSWWRPEIVTCEQVG